MSDLATEFSSMGDRLIKEHVTTQTVIEDHVASTENTIRLSISESLSQFREELLGREQDKAFEKQHERLLASLEFPEMNDRKNRIENNCPGTFDWIFKIHSLSSEPGQCENGSSQLAEDIEEGDLGECDYVECADTTSHSIYNRFTGWLKSDSNRFWISGKPASGKSSLMKFVAFNRLTTYYLKITHFFWKPGHLLQRNVKGMALALLYQVLDGQLDLGRKLWQTQAFIRHKRYPSDWSVDELSEALVWALSTSTGAICIFLNGLDEAEDLEQLPWSDWTDSHVIRRLLKVKNLKLCASSREEHAFCSFFKGSSRLRIHQLNDHDITRYSRERLNICDLECRARDSLVHKIVQRAEGVFLWVYLVVKDLNKVIGRSYTTIQILEECLEQTPSELSILYKDMWGRIGDNAQL
ncbi:hypothetical protein ACHAPI_004017 [Fusarium lateritium]